MEIRNETICYSKRKRQLLRSKEITLQQKIDKLDQEICNSGALNPSLLDSYEEAKNELKEIYDCKGKEAIFRSKMRWIEKGEKPTKYFFNLEKLNYEKKVISQLNGENGKIISDLNLINKEIDDFYCDLLTSKLSQSQQTEFHDNFNTFTCNLERPKLTIEEQISQESDLSLEELLTTIKSFENNKSPGDDGFTKEFYETFFDLVGRHLLNSSNEAFHNGQLSISQRRGVITLIPKEDSSLLDLSNWRPITLLNVDYKILAKVIAKRIESSLPKLINSDQTGFIKGRY